MSKFTKEEISLCKQVAEKHRKDLDEWGEWVCDEKDKGGKVVLVQRWIRIAGKSLIYEDSSGERADIKTTKWFPLWTISDCLEFLEKKGYGRIISFIHFDNGYWTFTAENIITSNNYKKARGEKANTKLEACLKAVLAVLEDKK